MQNVSKKMLVLFLTIVMLLSGVVTVLSACDDTSSAENAEQAGNVTELSVTYDENLTCDEASIADISDELRVEVVSGDARHAVEFSVKSWKVSEDGLYVEVVISAEGLEKTIRLPYSQEKAPAIRPELMPLYELLEKESDKSFTLSVAANAQSGTDAAVNSFTFKALANVPQEGMPELALVSGEDEGEKVLLLFKDEAIAFNGNVLSLDELQGVFTEVLGALGLGDGAEAAAEAPSFDLSEIIEKPDFTSAFVDFSAVLDTLDAFLDGPFAKNMDLAVTASDGVYSLSVDSKKLLALAELLNTPQENEEFGLNDWIDLFDTEMDGALKAGDVKVNLSLAVKADGVSLNVSLQNDKTGSNATLAVSFGLSEEPITMPEASTVLWGEQAAEEPETTAPAEALAAAEEGSILDAFLRDVEMTLPISFPQKNLSLTLRAVLHLSDLLTEDAKDIVTAALYYNDREEDVVHFTLNDNYVYLSISSLPTNESAGETEGEVNSEPTAPTVFYQAFEIDGEPATFAEVVINGVMQMFNTGMGNDPVKPGEVEPTEPTETNEPDKTEDPLGYGYTWETVDNAELVFPIGASEEDFREIFRLYIYDAEDNKNLYTDYELSGFDTSKSFSGEVQLVLGEDSVIEVPVVVCNMDVVQEMVPTVDEIITTIGSSAADVEEYVYATAYYTDGSVFWDNYVNGFEITAVNGESVDKNFTFNQVGDYELTVTRKGQELTAELHVFDPEHLYVVNLQCMSVYLWDYEKNIDETELREKLCVSVVYDDRSEEQVEDYEIVGYSFGVESFEVQRGDFTATVAVEYLKSEEQEKQFSLADLPQYLRFFEYEEDQPALYNAVKALFAAKDIYEENQALFENVFTVIPDENGAAVRIAVNLTAEETGEGAEAQDLFTLINLFVGIPTEEGWKDVDENTVVEMLSGGESQTGMNFDTMFTMVTGVSLADFLNTLYFNAGVSFEDGFGVTFDFGNGEEGYLSVGVHFTTVEESAHFVPTEEEVAAAQGFENAPMALALFLMQFIAA